DGDGGFVGGGGGEVARGGICGRRGRGAASRLGDLEAPRSGLGISTASGVPLHCSGWACERAALPVEGLIGMVGRPCGQRVEIGGDRLVVYDALYAAVGRYQRWRAVVP